MSKLTNTQNINLSEINNQISEIHNFSEFGFQEGKGEPYNENQNNQELSSAKK